MGGRSVLRGGHGNSRPRFLASRWSLALGADVGAIPRSLGVPRRFLLLPCCVASPSCPHTIAHVWHRAPSCVTCRGGRGLPRCLPAPLPLPPEAQAAAALPSLVCISAFRSAAGTSEDTRSTERRGLPHRPNLGNGVGALLGILGPL